MVQAAQGESVASADQIEWALDYVARRWAAVPEYARLWDVQWDDADKLDFEMEWAIPESWLDRLDDWNSEGMLTPQQRRRYRELRALVTRLRPTVERMLAP